MPEIMLERRRFLCGLGASAAVSALAACGSGTAEAKTFPIRHSEAEWRKLLSPEQFHILREAGTEPPFSSPLLKEHRPGRFLCAADANPLFSSETKYESGTGWPSFWAPLPRAIGTSTDYKLGYPRTAVHCSRCGGHIGHVFNDGPPPTGKRYCINGDAMLFIPAPRPK